MSSTALVVRPDPRRRPRSTVRDRDLDAAHAELAGLRGWTRAVAVVNDARVADGLAKTSRRAIRRAMKNRGRLQAYPRLRAGGRRPIKPLSADERKIARDLLGPTPRTRDYNRVADELSRRRIEAAGARRCPAPRVQRTLAHRRHAPGGRVSDGSRVGDRSLFRTDAVAVFLFVSAGLLTWAGGLLWTGLYVPHHGRIGFAMFVTGAVLATAFVGLLEGSTPDALDQDDRPPQQSPNDGR